MHEYMPPADRRPIGQWHVVCAAWSTCSVGGLWLWLLQHLVGGLGPNELTSFIGNFYIIGCVLCVAKVQFLSNTERTSVKKFSRVPVIFDREP